MNQPLDYARHLPTESDLLVFRWTRGVYITGTALIWMAIVFIVPMGLSHTSNEQAQNQIIITGRMNVIGGASTAWLIMGAIRIIRSELMRRSWMAWATFSANLLAVLFSLLVYLDL